MSRKIFVGDIHANANTFNELLNQIGLNQDDELYLLGDYIDRGINSKDVIDKIIQLQENYNVVPLRGNHEDNLIECLYFGYQDLVTQEFLLSFGIQNTNELPNKYNRFFKNLLYYANDKEFIAVHAGLNFKRDNPLLDVSSLMWIRDWYNKIDYQWLDGRFVIHGHTPQPIEETQKQLNELEKNQVINLDCGVYMKDNFRDGYGYLCGFDLTNRKLYFQKNID